MASWGTVNQLSFGKERSSRKLTSSAFGLGHQFPRAYVLTSGQQFDGLAKPWNNKYILFTKATSIKCQMDCLYIHGVYTLFWVLSSSPELFIFLLHTRVLKRVIECPIWQCNQIHTFIGHQQFNVFTLIFFNILGLSCSYF